MVLYVLRVKLYVFKQGLLIAVNCKVNIGHHNIMPLLQLIEKQIFTMNYEASALFASEREVYGFVTVAELLRE